MGALEDIISHLSTADQAAMQPETFANPAVTNVVNSLMTLPRRAIENSQYALDSGTYDPGPALEAAALPMGTGAIAGVPMRAGESVLGAGPIRAYHGSPHDFDAFDLSKIGTGEGAQTYGHGLYFAENEGVAKSYRDALKAQDSPGHMYQVDINADPEHFLDWDKPLNQQLPHVQDALKQAMGEPKWDQFKFADAKTAVKNGFIASDDKLAAQRLNQSGLPGIKYLDQGSRGAGEGSQNYVVFNDKLIDVARKYGIGGILGLSPSVLATAQQEDRQ